MRNNIRSVLGLIGMSLRGLRQRKVRTLLTIAAVMVGVAALISTSITEETAQKTISDIYNGAAGKADLIVTNATASIADTEGFDAGTLAQVQQTDGVELAAPLVQMTTSSSMELEDWDWTNYVSDINGTLLLGIDPELSSEIGHYNIISGDVLSEDSTDDALISQSYADFLGISPGDTLQLLITGGLFDFRIIGLIDNDGLALLNRGNVVLAELETVTTIAGRPGKLDQIDVATGSAMDQEQLKKNLESTLGSAYAITIPQAKGDQAGEMAKLISSILGFMALMVVAMGIFLIYNTFNATMTERRREMGLMRAIGVGKSHLLWIVLGEAYLLGLVGTILGIPMGIGLAQGLGRIFEETLNTQMNSPTLLPEHIVLAFIVGIGISLTASLIPAIQSSRLSPLEAISQYRDIIQTRSRRQLFLGILLLVVCLSIFIYHFFAVSDISFSMTCLVVLAGIIGIILIISQLIPPLEHLLSRFMRVLGIYGEMGGRNLGRRPVRTALTIGVIILGTASVITANSAVASLNEYNGEYIDIVVGSDLLVFSPQPMPRELVEDIDAIPGVEAATGVGFIPAKMAVPNSNDEADGIYLAFDPAVHTGQYWDHVWTDYAGSKAEAVAMLESGNAVFVQSYTAQHYGFEVGDSITLGTLEGKLPFEIAGIIYGREFTGFCVLGSWDSAQKFYGTTGSNNIKIKVNPGYDVSAVESDISSRWGETYHLKVEHYTDWYSKTMTRINEMSSTSDVMQLIGIIIVALAIINTLIMSIWERRRELGMLRAIGMTRRQLIGTIAAEALGLGLLGGIIGTGLSLLSMPTINVAYISLMELGADFPTVIDMQFVIAALVIALIVPITASLLPAWQGTRIDIVEAMRTE